MNKSQLLADLVARDGVLALIGDPVDTTPSGDIGIVKWYQQGLWHVNGLAAVKQSIIFYVANEGQPGEIAYYKDSEPTFESVKTSELKAWLRAAIDATPKVFAAPQIHWMSERWGMVVYSILEDDGSGGLKWQAYYTRKDVVAPIKISNHEASRLSSQFSL